jgi:hypothetical protein
MDNSCVPSSENGMDLQGRFVVAARLSLSGVFVNFEGLRPLLGGRWASNASKLLI